MNKLGIDLPNPTQSYDFFAAETGRIRQKEINFVNAYVKNDGNLELALAVCPLGKCKNQKYAAKKLLKMPRVQQYLTWLRSKSAIRTRWGYDDKLTKLRLIADKAVPDNAETIKERAADVAIKAIAEANRMQGDYSPEKRVNMNIDTDLEEAKELTKKLLEQYRSEY
jgi:hypothetical protein